MYGHTDINFSIDHDSKIPLYFQVENLLRKIIALPQYQEGELLPNEIDLAKRLGVSRSTARQAIGNLVDEKLLERKKGVGTRVLKQPTVSHLKNWLSFTREMKAKGLEVYNYEIDAGIASADEEVSSALKISKGREVFKLYRLRGTPERPAVVTTSWFHPRIGLSSESDFEAPLYEMLDKEYNILVHFSKEQIRAEKADAMIADKLGIEAGDPVLSRTRQVSDQGKRVVEYNKTYYRADSFTYFIELQRE